jgi:hypothetical protein
MRTETAHGSAMTDSTPSCPTCSALLRNEDQEGEGASAGSVRLWQCEHGHWWMQSPGLGWVAFDPGDIATDAATAMGVEE